MTKEDKELLLKYLCMALPYHIFVHSRAGGNDYELREVNVYSGSFGGTCAIPIPYLRPMSSMTDEELVQFLEIRGRNLNHEELKTFRTGKTAIVSTLPSYSRHIDWLNAHHFDYRGLIEKDLAIEITESNNPYKE